jgi:hypothetical protein
LAALPLLFIYDFKIFIIGLISILGHLIGDMTTKAGVMLFYPNKKVFHILPYQFLYKTGSHTEYIIMAGLVVIVGLLATFPIPKSEQQIITNETIKEIQQNIWDNKKILADVSYFEKNNKIELENVQILWIDYDSLYIERFATICKIPLKDVLNLTITNILDLDYNVERVNVKDLRDYAHRKKIITKVEFWDNNGEYWEDSGLWTGRDLYYYLLDNYNITTNSTVTIKYMV